MKPTIRLELTPEMTEDGRATDCLAEVVLDTPDGPRLLAKVSLVAIWGDDGRPKWANVDVIPCDGQADDFAALSAGVSEEQRARSIVAAPSRQGIVFRRAGEGQGRGDLRAAGPEAVGIVCSEWRWDR